MTTTQIQSSNVVVPAPDKKAIKLGLFPGAFGGFQRAFWHLMLASGIEKITAHKIAVDFGADLGRVMRADADVAATVSKANKNNESYLKLSGRSIRVANSPAMEVNRICVLAEALFNEKLVTKRTLPAPEVLQERIRDYIAECDNWAADNVFEE